MCYENFFSQKHHHDLLLEERDGPCFLVWQINRSSASWIDTKLEVLYIQMKHRSNWLYSNRHSLHIFSNFSALATIYTVSIFLQLCTILANKSHFSQQYWTKVGRWGSVKSNHEQALWRAHPASWATWGRKNFVHGRCVSFRLLASSRLGLWWSPLLPWGSCWNPCKRYNPASRYTDCIISLLRHWSNNKRFINHHMENHSPR